MNYNMNQLERRTIANREETYDDSNVQKLQDVLINFVPDWYLCLSKPGHLS